MWEESQEAEADAGSLDRCQYMVRLESDIKKLLEAAPIHGWELCDSRFPRFGIGARSEWKSQL